MHELKIDPIFCTEIRPLSCFQTTNPVELRFRALLTEEASEVELALV